MIDRITLSTGAARGVGAATMRALPDDACADTAFDFCAGAGHSD